MNFSVKVRLLITIFLTLFGLVFVRLFYLQVISSEKYSALAERQHFYTLELPARRGEIKAVDGIPLATDKNSYLLYAHLPEIPPDHNMVAEKVADILFTANPIISTESAVIKKNKDDLITNITERLDYKNALWVNLAHFLNQDTKSKLEELKISGLGFTSEEARDYPEGSMSAHLLGLVGSDPNGNPKGYFGLEGYYDRELSGRPGEIRVEKDAFGRPIAIGEELKRDKQDGRSLVTTIDRSVQLFVEKNLRRGIDDWKASGGTVIVMDPNTGAIIALANYPNYEPSRFGLYPNNLYKNPAIADLYEPGSIMKPLVVAAALNEGKITPDTRCDQCAGPRKIYDFYIHTFDNHYHPNETMTEVLINSDNTGMVFVGEKLGFINLYNYVKKFGFASKTGVDLQEEEEGSLRPAKDYYPIDQATLTFGQGININGLQMVKAFSVLANGGRLPTPYLVTKIQAQGQEINLKHTLGAQIISEATVKTITEMLIQVANNSPEHFPKDRIPELANFRIAAKSGTAQIAVGGKYKSTGTIASVIGYFPADKPRFVVMVKLNEPEVRPWGSDTAGPVFFQIIKDLIQYYGISP